MKTIRKFALEALTFVLLSRIIIATPLDATIKIRAEEVPDDISSYSLAKDELKEARKDLDQSVQPGRGNRYDCPWPFQLIADSCLHFSDLGSESSSWEHSRVYCWALNADLGSFGDEEELILLFGYMDGAKETVYMTGGSRHNSTSDFQWLDGSSLPDTSSPLWDYQEGKDYNCVVLLKIGGFYKLRNTYCSTEPYHKLCKLS